MGSNKSWFIILVMFCTLLSPFVQAMDTYYNDSESLDAVLHDHAHKALIKPRTGILYDVSLPANFSGMQVSIVRLRSASFWARGANFSFFHIPPRIIPIPLVKRLDIVYQNLGNLSSHYYNVPNYTLITPVIGFMMYNSNTSTKGNAMLNLSIKGDPILVNFPKISLIEENRNVTVKCVRFGTNGLVELSNMTMQSSCVAWGQGHFSIAIPSTKVKKKDLVLWKWRVIGFGGGVFVLILSGLVGILIYKVVRKKRIGKMERESGSSETLSTIWVGKSRMPSAEGMRTQPVLENDYVP